MSPPTTCKVHQWVTPLQFPYRKAALIDGEHLHSIEQNVRVLVMSTIKVTMNCHLIMIKDGRSDGARHISTRDLAVQHRNRGWVVGCWMDVDLSRILCIPGLGMLVPHLVAARHPSHAFSRRLHFSPISWQGLQPLHTTPRPWRVFLTVRGDHQCQITCKRR
ncbi:hypothetical protein B0F90DRAFT_872498 [Multifurca ochricompacta]|uniref:Uncharacterized protein n=1 Tax=Multifurca ochricompacta TaxID=376703 RepID=A0AAD4M2D5_9AGAM|nr:hypothetical protein B0F90DRAFT_872498 [Multifurca ochricompacta]